MHKTDKFHQQNNEEIFIHALYEYILLTSWPCDHNQLWKNGKKFSIFATLNTQNILSISQNQIVNKNTYQTIRLQTKGKFLNQLFLLKVSWNKLIASVSNKFCYLTLKVNIKKIILIEKSWVYSRTSNQSRFNWLLRNPSFAVQKRKSDKAVKQETCSEGKQQKRKEKCINWTDLRYSETWIGQLKNIFRSK